MLSTNVIGPIVPASTGDEFPTHYDYYGYGGYRVVNTFDELNSITVDRQRVGMVVYCLENSLTYRLNTTGINLSTSNWDVTQSEQGAQGVTGPQGDQGAQGVAGVQGAQGVAGVQGTQGVAGVQGTQGVAGVQGTQGVAGVTGVQGAQGVAGVTGVQGAQGVAGSTGVTGVQGVAGVQGAQGVVGSTGVTGVQGAQGVVGSTGVTGVQGAQGVAGVTGVTGPIGPSYISVGITNNEPIPYISGLTITSSETEVVLYNNSTFTGQPNKYTVPGRSFTLTDNSGTNYLYIEYNNGSPQYNVSTDVNVINESDSVPVNTLYVSNGYIHSSHWDRIADGLVNKLHRRFVKTQRYAWESGLGISVSGVDVNINNGVVWRGARSLTLYDCNSNLTSVSGTNGTQWFFLTNTNGVWSSTPKVSPSDLGFNNTQYNPISGPTTLTGTNVNNSYYNINWIYRGIEDHQHAYIILSSQQYKDLPTAIAVTKSPDIPSGISSHMMLIGRIIVQKNQTVIPLDQIEMAFGDGVTFTGGAVINDHNKLSNLQGGTGTTEYYHLTLSDYLKMGNMVTGPVSGVNGNVALFDGISGKLIKDGGTLGTAAFTDTGAYDPAGAAATVSGALSTHEGLTSAHGLQIATTSVAGLVKPDGTTVTIDVDGTIHSSAGGAVDSVNGQTGTVVLNAANVGAVPDWIDETFNHPVGFNVFNTKADYTTYITDPGFIPPIVDGVYIVLADESQDNGIWLYPWTGGIEGTAYAYTSLIGTTFENPYIFGSTVPTATRLIVGRHLGKLFITCSATYPRAYGIPYRIEMTAEPNWSLAAVQGLPYAYLCGGNGYVAQVSGSRQISPSQFGVSIHYNVGTIANFHAQDAGGGTIYLVPENNFMAVPETVNWQGGYDSYDNDPTMLGFMTRYSLSALEYARLGYNDAWFTGTLDPNGQTIDGSRVGDFYLQSTGDVWQKASDPSTWTWLVNVSGTSVYPGDSPTVQTSFGLSSAGGLSDRYARIDHAHGTPTWPDLSTTYDPYGSAATVSGALSTHAGLTTSAHGGIVALSGSTMTGNLTLPTVSFDTTYTTTGIEPTGRLYWDTTNHTLSVVLENGVILQIGQENHIYAKNTSGVAISNGNACSLTAVGGTFTTIAKTDATNRASALGFVGLATQDIAINAFGYVTVFGSVHDINTNGLTEGGNIYVDPATPGLLTQTEPAAPNYSIDVGKVEYAHSVHGRILVQPHTMSRLTDLSDVDGTPLTTTGQILVWNNTAGYWDVTANINNYVTGPASATSGHIAVFDGATGKIIKDGGAYTYEILYSNAGDVTVKTGTLGRIVKVAGVVTEGSVRFGTAGTTGDTTIAVKNGSNTVGTCTIASGGTTGTLTLSSTTLTAGDVLTVDCTAVATTAPTNLTMTILVTRS